MIQFEYPEGATPIDDISGLKLSPDFGLF